jgi:hypothetical protein
MAIDIAALGVFLGGIMLKASFFVSPFQSLSGR